MAPNFGGALAKLDECMREINLNLSRLDRGRARSLTRLPSLFDVISANLSLL